MAKLLGWNKPQAGETWGYFLVGHDNVNYHIKRHGMGYGGFYFMVERGIGIEPRTVVRQAGSLGLAKQAAEDDAAAYLYALDARRRMKNPRYTADFIAPDTAKVVKLFSKSGFTDIAMKKLANPKRKRNGSALAWVSHYPYKGDRRRNYSARCSTGKITIAPGAQRSWAVVFVDADESTISLRAYGSLAAAKATAARFHGFVKQGDAPENAAWAALYGKG